MAYFQNVFNSEFIGVAAISDRQYSKDYRIRGNVNTPLLMMNWVDGPYDTSTANLFGIKYSMDAGNTYNQINVTLTSSASTSAEQIVADLNANASFASMFTASTSNNIPRAYDVGTVPPHYAGSRIYIQANSNFREVFRAYIPNLANPSSPSTSAENVLKFNLKAPVVQMPSYFARYTLNVGYPGATLYQLSQPDENFVITNAGLGTTPLADWQLLAGTSGLFQFQKITVDGSNRITQIIEYPAGAAAGDLARLIGYVYSGANTNPSQITEIPYVLQTGDLVTPP